MPTLIRHLSCAALVAAASSGPARAQPAGDGDAATFTVLVRGARVGSQTVTLAQTGSGWTISSVGRLEAPFNLVTTKFEVTYDADWQAGSLVIEGLLGGKPLALTTTFGPNTATNELTQGGERASNTLPVSPRAVVVPDNFFGAYEALAMRLRAATPGTRLPVYRAPEGEATATVDAVTTRRFASLDGPIAIRVFAITVATPRGPFPLEVWTDERSRLARVALPVSSVVVLRDDLGSLMTREEHVANPGDEPVFIPANGFNLAGTITQPAGAARSPAVVLVAGVAEPGRDRLTDGVPLFGQLAGRLADAGYLVVRYDGRGTGQSGGRTESAGLAAYAEDAVAVVSWLRRRDDVDDERLAVVGYDDSAPIALIAAGRERRIRGVALMAAAGWPGRDAVLFEQERLLARLEVSETERAARIDLQRRVIEATISGRGWEGIPADVRRDADTPWFRSWLLFDPAEAIDRVRQPLLVVHGALDREVPAAHADRLEELGRTARDQPPALTTKAIVPGVNHLLVAATTGEVGEYAALPSPSVAPAVTSALVAWLRSVVPAR